MSPARNSMHVTELSPFKITSFWSSSNRSNLIFHSLSWFWVNNKIRMILQPSPPKKMKERKEIRMKSPWIMNYLSMTSNIKIYSWAITFTQLTHVLGYDQEECLANHWILVSRMLDVVTMVNDIIKQSMKTFIRDLDIPPYTLWLKHWGIVCKI